MDGTMLQIRRNGKGCLSYLFGSKGEAIVVDPCVHESVYRGIAEREGLNITHIAETHVHADHLSRGRDLSKSTGASLLLPTNHRVAYQYTPVRDGQEIRIGDISVRAITTPGHTGESLSYLVGEEAILTGDTLFVESVGRPDLEKGDAGAEAGARTLYKSLQERLLNLSGIVKVCPGHVSWPLGFDGESVVATLDDVKSGIDLLRADEETFVNTILSSLGAKPPNFQQVIAVNEGRADLPVADPIDLEAGPNRCAIQ